jgi:phage tail P2-like protein
MNNTLLEVDFTRALPAPLRDDEKMLALGKAIAGELQENIRLARLTIIYARIDELDDELLDILARDLHVDWYDDTHPVAAKRQTIKDSVRVHKRLATKYAIETALRGAYPHTEVREWYEYDGTHHRFSIVLDLSNAAAPANFRDILRAARFYKRLTAHLDDLIYRANIQKAIFFGANIYERRGVVISTAIEIGKINGNVYFGVSIAEKFSIALL